MFIGRARELALLQAAFDSLAERGGALVLVSGEPGIGKTSLLEEFRRTALESGAAVLAGRCSDAAGGPPYAPFAEMIKTCARSGDAAELPALVDAAASILGLTPKIADQVESPANVSSPPDLIDERVRVFDAVAQLFIAIARDTPLVLTIDDLQWAGPDGLEMLRHLARSCAQSRVLIAASLRSADAHADPAVHLALAQLRREARTEDIELEAMNPTEMRAFLESFTERRISSELVSAIAGDTQGNPLFARELMLHLVKDGGLGAAVRPDEAYRKMFETAAPTTVTDAINLRIRNLSEDARLLLTTASTFTAPWALEVVASAAVLGLHEALDALDELLVARLVRVDTSGAARYEFWHPIIRKTLYAELNPSRQARLHRRAAEALIKGGATTTSDTAAEIAQQYWLSRSLPGADAGAPFARMAAENARRRAAFSARVRFAYMAVDLTPENDQGYPYALGELAAALTWVAEFRTAVGYAKEAAARIAGSQGDVAAAAFLENFMSHGPENMPMSHAADLARDGLRYLGVLRNETWVRFRMYSLFAEEQDAPNFTGILTCRDPEWQRLFEMSREHGWTPVFFPIAPGTRSEIIEHYSHWPALMLLFAGELRRSRLTYRPDEVRDGPLAAAIGWARVALCEAALGELASAAEDVGRATVLARRIGAHLRATTAIGDAGFVLTFVRDRGWERLSAQLGPATQGANVYGIDAAGFAVTAAVAHARLGRGEDAMQALARVLPAIEEGDGRIYGYTRLVCCASEVHWLLDRQDHVALLESKLRDTIVAPDYRAPGVDARRSLAHLCALSNRFDEAAGWFARARETLEDQGAAPLRAIVDFDEALMLIRRGARGDAMRSRPLLERARDQFQRLDMRGWLERAEELAASIDRRGYASQPQLPDRLTPREAEVLRLLASGMTNSEISAQLVLSVRTVARHITNIYAKIGARSKADATAYAIRHGLA